MSDLFAEIEFRNDGFELLYLGAEEAQEQIELLQDA